MAVLHGLRPPKLEKGFSGLTFYIIRNFYFDQFELLGDIQTGMGLLREVPSGPPPLALAARPGGVEQNVAESTASRVVQ